jgi:aminoglycoside phosphotransferase (APT) family kinase protein
MRDESDQEQGANSDTGRQTEKVVAWIEAHLDARVLEVETQARWRPVWFVDIEIDGEKYQLCVRGDRIDARHGFPLEHEMKLQQELHRAGIPVPRVWGWCDDPRAYVMDRVSGVEHFRGCDDSERDAVMNEYMEILARIHRLDITPFASAGILRAEKPEDSGRLGIAIYEEAYRASKKRPDPCLEFCLAWLKRNPVGPPTRECVIVWDSGQLMHRDGRVQAVMDLEIGHIGDPMMDLAGFRMRTSVLGFGDFEKLYAHYELSGGFPIDRAAIQHHHFAFTLSNQLAFHAALAEPPPGSDFMTNMQWCAETNIYAMEALAAIKGVELEAVPMPDAKISSQAVGHAHLVDWLRHFEAPDAQTQHQFRIFFRLARHLQRSDEIGAQVENANLDDLEPLLGVRPKNWQEGDALLERFVLEDEGRHDDEILRILHRRNFRYSMLLGPAGSAIARHNPIPEFEF